MLPFSTRGCCTSMRRKVRSTGGDLTSRKPAPHWLGWLSRVIPATNVSFPRNKGPISSDPLRAGLLLCIQPTSAKGAAGSLARAREERLFARGMHHAMPRVVSHRPAYRNGQTTVAN